MILEGKWADLAVMLAPVCSSFCAPNQGTAARDILNIWGNFFHPSVACGNKMMSRRGLDWKLHVCNVSVFGSMFCSRFVSIPWEVDIVGNPDSGDGRHVHARATVWIITWTLSPTEMVGPYFETGPYPSFMAILCNCFFYDYLFPYIFWGGWSIKNFNSNPDRFTWIIQVTPHVAKVYRQFFGWATMDQLPQSGRCCWVASVASAYWIMGSFPQKVALQRSNWLANT